MSSIIVNNSLVKAENQLNGMVIEADDGNDYVCERDVWELYCDWRSETKDELYIITDANPFQKLKKK